MVFKSMGGINHFLRYRLESNYIDPTGVIFAIPMPWISNKVLLGEKLFRQEAHPSRCRGAGGNEKKLPDLFGEIDWRQPDKGSIGLMFQDEARFGRISDNRRRRCPKAIRPLWQSMVTQWYACAYAAASYPSWMAKWTVCLPVRPNSTAASIFGTRSGKSALQNGCLRVWTLWKPT